MKNLHLLKMLMIGAMSVAFTSCDSGSSPDRGHPCKMSKDHPCHMYDKDRDEDMDEARDERMDDEDKDRTYHEYKKGEDHPDYRDRQRRDSSSSRNS